MPDTTPVHPHNAARALVPLASDPTELTVDLTEREISHVKELLQNQLDAIERAITVAHDDLVRVPTEVDKRTSSRA